MNCINFQLPQVAPFRENRVLSQSEKIDKKSLKYTKITQKVTFPLTFVIWCKKQRWPKIQFYLLEHIFSTKFVHFPIDISDFFFGGVLSIFTLNKAKILADPRKGLNLRA